MPSAPLINSPPGRPPDESSSFEGREYGAFLETVEFNGTLEERVRSFVEFGAPVALLRQGVRTSDRVRWREAIKEGSAEPLGCPIKGNISWRGERIYHLPWQRDYKRTKIHTAKGERWFCNEGEALAAGWRRAKR